MSKSVSKISNPNPFEFVKNVKEPTSTHKTDEASVNSMKLLGFNENLWGSLNLGNLTHYCYPKITQSNNYPETFARELLLLYL